MATVTEKNGQVANGVRSIRYDGYTSHALPSPKGLVVQAEEKGLLLIGPHGQRQLWPTNFGWTTTDAGLAIQDGTRYYLVSYDTGEIQLTFENSVPWHMDCCKTGFILRHKGHGFKYIPFSGGKPLVFWDKPCGSCCIVDDGVVLHSGQPWHGEWMHARIDGTVKVIYGIRDHLQNAGINCAGNLWVCEDDQVFLYPWDGREPAVTKYSGCGGCCQGIVANFESKVVVYRFGGGELVLWEGPYKKWHGSCDMGLFIVRDDEVILLPYDGSPPKTLWQGPFNELRPLDSALLVHQDKEVVMIPLPQ